MTVRVAFLLTVALVNAVTFAAAKTVVPAVPARTADGAVGIAASNAISNMEKTFTIVNNSSFYLKTTTDTADNCNNTQGGGEWYPQKTSGDSILLAGRTAELHMACTNAAHTQLSFNGDCDADSTAGVFAVIQQAVPGFAPTGTPQTSQIEVNIDGDTITFSDASGHCTAKLFSPPTQPGQCGAKDASSHACGGAVASCTGAKLAKGENCLYKMCTKTGNVCVSQADCGGPWESCAQATCQPTNNPDFLLCK